MNRFLLFVFSFMAFGAFAQDKGHDNTGNLVSMQKSYAKSDNNGAGLTGVSGLPLRRSFVQPAIIERARQQYGEALYSIEKSGKAPNCNDAYLVGLILGGKLAFVWMCADLKVALAGDGGTRVAFR